MKNYKNGLYEALRLAVRIINSSKDKKEAIETLRNHMQSLNQQPQHNKGGQDEDSKVE